MVFCNTLHSLPLASVDTAPSPTPKSKELPPAALPPVLGAQEGRNLILCFDGTGGEYDKDVSNIVRFFQMLKKGDPSRQMVYYQPGIGTGIKNTSANPFLKKFSVIVDAAIANGLPTHVRGGYEFLMNNYKEGDRISLFGYSRGAYTARALAGMLQKVGLLPADNREQIKFAYRNYQKDDEEGWKMSQGFKRAYSIDVKIDFVGVFDTVNSVGLTPRELPFANSNYLIRVFRHALALDERRTKYEPNLWGHTTEMNEELIKCSTHEIHGWINKIWNYISGGKNTKRCRAYKCDNSDTPIHWDGHDFASPEERPHETDVKEVWFAGAHGDIGGGAVENDTPNDLARIPLRWMVRQCFAKKTGILFHSSELKAIGLDPASLLSLPVTKVPTPSKAKLADANKGGSACNKENTTADMQVVSAPLPDVSKLVQDKKVRLGTTEDEKDAVQKIHDPMSLYPIWWILELFLIKERYQRSDGTWRSLLLMDLGKPRVIPDQKQLPTLVHRSVLYRMQQPDLQYEPRAKLLENIEYVD
ncbi:putative protein YEL023C OS=Saccharomyces cerevisiae (strain ATCC 204508 / S288c) GN=YEL023C PE=4 SV=1 [Rhizoctonia solani AG-1 IB]|uniref:T6SS Phospholipase effector Tle1-like catalytic domain-containing protein n=1 Tax=Thanatephorus cucumeris (strain AG1-IB / isolate 7/3/14) TaxID=1108050 RepID=A0A0B7FW18_THACB|nr:putative protein YEL023C OS=Saccharomyces cerevisiae (strain ATCC 204508 / S288c) GN=YEL023C PE=4 SV=1 [Rhizoctonia solani AG-1 IB]